jgi:hypothetical protein
LETKQNIIPLSIILRGIKMKSSPFVYGNTVSTKAFTDREKEVNKLFANLTGGINTMIISPRRWGKSSLVEHVVNMIRNKDKNCRVVMIDLFTVNNSEEFLEKFALEVLKSSSTKWQEWIENSKKFFKNIIPKIQVSSDPANSFSVSFDWQELKKHADEILDLPEQIATRNKIKLVICLDEFQSIAGFSNYEEIEKRMRALWQRHKSVTYCIYGSQRHMMTDIFSNPSKPFFRFGDIILLEKIDREKWIEFIVKSFSETRKTITEAEAEIIATLMKDHPWYVQQLSHYVWNLTTKSATKTDIKSALVELINANMPLYQKEIGILSITQINLLKAVSQGENKLTSARVMTVYRLGTPRNVSKNKTVLINNDIIFESGGNYSFLDPAFEIWFRNTYLKTPITI